MILRGASALSVLLVVGCGGDRGQPGSYSGEAGSPGTQDASTTASPSSFGTGIALEDHIPNPPVSLLASDGSDLFWTDGVGGLWRASVGGGSPTQIASGVAGFGGAPLFLDSTNAYFALSDGFASAPKQGGPTSVLVQSGGIIEAATIAGGTAYWVELDASNRVLVKSAPLITGGAVTTLGTLPGLVPPSAIAVAGTTIFIGGASSPPAVFVTDGGSPTPLGTFGCSELLAGAGAVYCSGTSLALVTAGGTTSTEIAANVNDVTSLAVDATNVYWVNDVTSGSVMTAPRSGGASTTVASDTAPTAVAVDDTAVYWGDSAGKIWRAAKLWR
jgi:hypothetical protein